jgi:hypothetical protein
MKVVYIQENQLKAVTLFLIDKGIIYHPTISPDGCPDFTGRFGRNNILIIDRNIMTKIIELCRAGRLKDAYIRKLIGALLFWAEFNDITMTGGLALNEYATGQCNDSASIENNIFLKMFEQYSPQTWLEVFENKIETIKPIELDNAQKYSFAIENEHYLMHLAEVIFLFRLYLDCTKDACQKVKAYLSWVGNNQLFCAYSVTYACMLFSNKTKLPKIRTTDDFETMLKRCSNQAWDLSYLSTWSTLYWDELNTNNNYLFATMDTELKKIFIHTHDVKSDIFYRFFGPSSAIEIRKHYDHIINSRVKPVMTRDRIQMVLDIEKMKLREGCIP